MSLFRMSHCSVLIISSIPVQSPPDTQTHTEFLLLHVSSLSLQLRDSNHDVPYLHLLLPLQMVQPWVRNDPSLRWAVLPYLWCTLPFPLRHLKDHNCVFRDSKGKKVNANTCFADRSVCAGEKHLPYTVFGRGEEEMVVIRGSDSKRESCVMEEGVDTAIIWLLLYRYVPNVHSVAQYTA